MPKPQLAKISRPRLYGAVVRERLFHALYQARQHPVTWVAGPPGAGKTTVVASYLTAMNVTGIWYQADSGDGDTATFYYYLGTAAAAVTGKKKWKPLPLWTPACASDLKGFSRRYFRELFALLPEGAVIVFDNYQEAPTEGGLSAVLGVAIGEIPQGVNAIVISRTDPPEDLAWALISGRVATLGWQELRLSLEETQQIAQASRIRDPKVVQMLYEQSNGWVAGLTLMLERLRRDGIVGNLHRSDTMDMVFGYFAGQIFDSAAKDVQEVLMQTAFFPRFTASLANAITGNFEAGRIVDQLYRRHLFTERRIGEETTYQYHALFQAFLKQRARQLFGAVELRTLMLRAATLLGESGHEAAAFALWCEAGEWARASKVLLNAAPRLIGQGRLQTVQDWASCIPEATVASDPWIGYWIAMSLEPVRRTEARAALKPVFAAFLARGDEIGQIMSAAGILDTIYTEYADLVPMDPWIDVLAKLLGGNPVFPSDEFELRAYQSFVGTVYRAPRNPLLKSCVERVEALLKQPFDVNLKVVAGQRLGAYADATTDVELSRRVSEAITPLLDSVELTPANAALFLNMKGYDLYIAWKIDDALACFARAKAIARREGLANEEFRTGVYQAICERRTGRLAAAQRTISELETMPRPERGALLSIHEILKALIAYSRGDIKLAVAAAQESLHLGTTFGNVFIESIVCVFNAQFLIAAGDLKSASSLLKRSRLLASGSAIDNARAYIALNEAHVAHLLGDTAQREQRLREALEFARTASGRARQRWFPEAMSALFPVALKEGIEPDLVRSLIREFDLSPESRDVEGWPWPVKLYTLGRFRALLDNRPLEFSRKSPKKTMTLLKALIAFGGKKVSEQKLIDALWPNEDGDDAHHAFNSALHRLRKLLGDKDLIVQSGGAISLDEHRCWIDAVAFEGLLAGVALNGAELGEASLDNLSRSITLYTGNFLQNEEDAPWAVSFRERLRARFVQAVSCYAQQLEKSGRTKEAIDCYLTGLEADDLVEPFYQGLMRCYDKINRRSEAIGVYRRMRQTLSVTLGIRPSAASEGLYQSLQGG